MTSKPLMCGGWPMTSLYAVNALLPMSDRDMITDFGNDDPTTRRLMAGILAMEAEHADAVVSLLADLGSSAVDSRTAHLMHIAHPSEPELCVERSMAVRLGTVICALALLAGCGASRSDLQHFTPDLQRLTARQISCPPGGMTLSDLQGDAAMASWTATCQGHRYVCTAEDTFREVSCVRTLEEKQP
jgi:hypothetical protein